MSPQPLRTDNLALAFQELITVGERLRCNRQMVSDAASFRAQIWAALKTASDQARNRGYPQEDIELATFAVIAFVDESILNLRHPIFADWPRQPLQEERYGHHVAGEIFFQNLQKLLLRTDTAQLADLLEVYYLCLMLGFAGRYSLGGRSELMAIMQQTADKLQRIRQTSTILSPDSQPPADAVRRVSGDSVARALLFVAIGCAILTITLFIVFYVTLGNGVNNLQKTARNTDFSLSWSPCGVGLWPARDAKRRIGLWQGPHQRLQADSNAGDVPGHGALHRQAKGLLHKEAPNPPPLSRHAGVAGSAFSMVSCGETERRV